MFEGNALQALIDRLRGSFIERTGKAALSAPDMQIGIEPDVTIIDRDGTMTAHGAATAWEDLRIEPAARTSGGNAPAFEQYFTNGAGSRGVYLYSFDNAVVASEKEVFFTVQMPHAWAQTTIHLHLHWIPAASGASSAVRWGLEYTWAGIGQVFGNTTLDYSSTTAQGDTSLVANKHYLTEFTDIAPSTTQASLSSVLIGRIWRNSSHGDDTYTGKAGLLYIDIHYEVDSLGSFDEYSKPSYLSDEDGVLLHDEDGAFLTDEG